MNYFCVKLYIVSYDFRYKYTERKKEMHILFCYLYQRCMNCANESRFEMFNIHICTHCDTFHCKETTCVLHFNGSGDKGNEREIQAVFNNRKN